MGFHIAIAVVSDAVLVCEGQLQHAQEERINQDRARDQGLRDLADLFPGIC